MVARGAGRVRQSFGLATNGALPQGDLVCANGAFYETKIQGEYGYDGTILALSP